MGGRLHSRRICSVKRHRLYSGSNQPLQTAADAIVTELRADGYVSADTNSILITVEAGKGDARLRSSAGRERTPCVAQA